jgi:hypothetical protein
MNMTSKTFNKNTCLRLLPTSLLMGIMLIASGAEISAMDPIDLNEQLFRAAYCGNEIMVQELITAGAQVNARDCNKRTPLMLASIGKGEKAKKLKIIALLIKHNADLEAQQDIGLTALMEAAASGNKAICKLLIAHKANIHMRDTTYGGTALMWAGNGPVCSLLTRLGANINDTDTTQQKGTALSWAVAGFPNPSKYDTVKTLLELIIQLKPDEKNIIKNWLLISKKMEIEQGIFLPEEMRLLIAKILCRSLVQELHERLGRAGSQKALEMAEYRDVPDIATLLEETANLHNLERYVREQTSLPKLTESPSKLEERSREQPETQYEESAVAANAFKRMKIMEAGHE